MSDPFGLRTNEKALEEAFLRLQLRCSLNLKPSAACADLVKVMPVLSLIDSAFKDDLEEGLIQQQELLNFLGHLISGPKTGRLLRKSAIYLLAFIEAEQLLPVLEPVLHDRDRDTVLETIRTIALTGTLEAFNILVDFFQTTKDKQKRLEILRNIYHFSIDQADLLVEENLHSKDKDTVKAALEAAYGILYTRASEKVAKGIEEVIFKLLVDSRSLDIQRLALELVILTRPSGAVNYLVNALNRLIDSPLSEEIVLALEEFDDQRIPSILQSISTDFVYPASIRQLAYSLTNKSQE